MVGRRPARACSSTTRSSCPPWQGWRCSTRCTSRPLAARAILLLVRPSNALLAWPGCRCTAAPIRPRGRGWGPRIRPRSAPGGARGTTASGGSAAPLLPAAATAALGQRAPAVPISRGGWPTPVPSLTRRRTTRRPSSAEDVAPWRRLAGRRPDAQTDGTPRPSTTTTRTSTRRTAPYFSPGSCGSRRSHGGASPAAAEAPDWVRRLCGSADGVEGSLRAGRSPRTSATRSGPS